MVVICNGKFFKQGGTAFTLYNSRYNNFVNWGEVITKSSWGYDYVPGENGTPENEFDNPIPYETIEQLVVEFIRSQNHCAFTAKKFVSYYYGLFS